MMQNFGGRKTDQADATVATTNSVTAETGPTLNEQP